MQKCGHLFFDKDIKVYLGKWQTLQQMMLGKLKSYLVICSYIGMGLSHYLSHRTNINSKLTKDFNLITESLKQLEETPIKSIDKVFLKKITAQKITQRIGKWDSKTLKELLTAQKITLRVGKWDSKKLKSSCTARKIITRMRKKKSS